MIEENDLSRLKQITNEHSGLFVLGSECREERILENLARNFDYVPYLKFEDVY